MDIERAAPHVKRGYKAGNKVHTWYSRLSKVKKILLWLLALFVVAIALGVGLGVGLQPSHGGEDENNDSDN
ncbi:hypothetical protein LTR86_008142 [Recurvomyces mirabilis]|nr:hypothetical protein LTR86_008142 [Recurvomyces mirabilis]